MINITKELIRERFKKYNKICFNKKLKIPEIRIGKSNGLYGEFAYKKILDDGTILRPHIWIAKNVDWNDYTLDAVLLHEMVHYYLVTNKKGLKHNKNFRNECNRIWNEYGIYVHQKGEKLNAPFIFSKKKKVSIYKRLRQIFINYFR